MAKGHRTEQQKQATQVRREQRRAKAERAKAAQAAARRAAKRKERLTYALVVVAVLAVVAGGYFLIRAFDNTSGTTTAPAGGTDDHGIAVGPADAEHEVVIYEDFLCPACRSLESTLDEQLSAAVEEGTVRVEYRVMDFLSHRGDYSMRSANAFAAVSETAGPEAAKEFHDAVFAEQPPESGPFPDDDFLVEQAVAAGAPEDEVRPLIEQLGFEGWVADGTDAASRAGIRSTPTVLVDGQQVTGQSIDAVARAVLGAIG